MALAAMLLSPTVTHGQLASSSLPPSRLSYESELSSPSLLSQFHTILSDNDLLSLSLDPYSFPMGEEKATKDGAKAMQVSAMRVHSQIAERSLPSRTAKLRQNPKAPAPVKKNQLKEAKLFSRQPAKKAPKANENSLLDTNDSVLFDIIRKRLNICMPLNYMQMTSKYGYRMHPIKRCRRFHDGIDLASGNTLTFSMLPGRVLTVRHGNTGYGNYIVLDHGQLRCLYGHLSKTLVVEGDIVDAGTAIGITGHTGMASGDHLHLRLEKWNGRQWVSVDPKVFTDYLESYIAELGDELRKYDGQPDIRETELTVASLYAALKRHGVKHPKIVLAQAILETGWFRSQVARSKNNLFGLRNPRTGEYYSFNTWEDSIDGYVSMVQYKYRQNENYYAFLSRIRYAGDRNYTRKVMEIANRL